MAVAETGEYQGSLSGGCIEAAVVTEALETLKTGQPRMQSYGAGSPLIDIRLPCGGAVELLFTPITCVAAIMTALDQRQPFTQPLCLPSGPPLSVSHAPPLRLSILGHGGTVDALTRLSLSIGVDVAIFTPDSHMADHRGHRATLLKSTKEDVSIPSDPWTAICFLFHDHDWETALIMQALDGPALIIGAMGSHKTHAKRLNQLRSLGVSEEKLDRIKSPIGLIPSSRDPETLALSILSEAVEAYNATAPTVLSVS